MKLKRQLFRLGDLTLQLDVPVSGDSVLQHSLSGDSENPYWGIVWDAAVPMAEYLLNQDWSNCGRALELGCGMGLTGIAAWKAGLPIQMTDIVPEAVQLASQNCKLNRIEDSLPEVRDWNRPPQAAYQTVIACDVLYERSQHAGLLNFLIAASTKDTVIHIGDPGRQSAEHFIEDARSAKFEVTLCDKFGNQVSILDRNEFRVILMRSREKTEGSA